MLSPSCQCARAPGPRSVPAAGFSQGVIGHPTIVFDASASTRWVPLVTFIENYNVMDPYSENAGQSASVYRLNTVDAALSWGLVGPLLFTPSGTAHVSMQLDSFGNPWVAFASGQGLTGAHAVLEGQGGWQGGWARQLGVACACLRACMHLVPGPGNVVLADLGP